MSILERPRERQVAATSVRRLKRKRLRELIRRDMVDADDQKRGYLSAYQKAYGDLLLGSVMSFLLGALGTAYISATTGVDLTALALVPSAACGVVLTQSEKLVYFSRLRRGKVRLQDASSDLGELQADSISREAD